LAELQKNGRTTNVELAELVHISPSPCLTRVKRLQAAGYITGYSAHIDLAKLGDVVTIFTEVTLSNHRPVDFSRFQAALATLDTVLECHLISGGYDYLVKFVTRGIVEYQDTMERLIGMNIGIEKYFSYVVIKSPIERKHLPLSRFFADPA